jgi:endoglucanase
VKYEPDTNYYETFLRPAVDYATEKGLYVIIDWHYVGGTAAHPDTTVAFWSDIAPRFKDDSNVLFELFNEPTDGGSWATTTNPNMQAWFDQVRKDAPDNLILVGSANWDQQVGDAVTSPLEGTNIVYTAHMYPQHWQIAYLQDQITTAAASAPVFVTEWGFEESQMAALLQGTITSYGDPFKQFLEERHLSWSAWCASSSWNPPMFNTDYTLRVGEGEMGGFVKDWLYERRNDDLAQP